MKILYSITQIRSVKSIDDSFSKQIMLAMIKPWTMTDLVVAKVQMMINKNGNLNDDTAADNNTNTIKTVPIHIHHEVNHLYYENIDKIADLQRQIHDIKPCLHL